jgi:hypothetical protein
MLGNKEPALYQIKGHDSHEERTMKRQTRTTYKVEMRGPLKSSVHVSQS